MATVPKISLDKALPPASRKASAVSKSGEAKLKGVHLEAANDKVKTDIRSSKAAGREDDQNGRQSRNRSDGRDSKLKMPEMGTQGGADPARREKLRTALIAKLMSKYHPGIAHSKTEALVHREVDEIMKLRKVSEQHLHAIEAKVRKQSNEEVAFLVTNPFKRVTAFKSGAKDEWAQMNDLVVRAGREAEAQKQAAARAKKLRLRNLLDEQMTELEARRAMEKAQRDAESQRLLGDVHAYQQASEQRKADQKSALERMRQERAREMTDTKARHDKWLEEKRAEEQREMDKVRAMQAEDYERLVQRKRDNQTKMNLWRVENENNLAEKKRQRQEQQQQDRDFARKAQQALEEAEARRVAELHKINAKMQARGVLAAELGESNAAIAAQDEARMLKVQAEARAKAEAEFQDRQRKAIQKRQDIRNTLDRQIQEAVERKQAEQDMREQQSQIFKKEALEAQAEMQRQEEARRRAQEEYRMQLEDQLRYGVKVKPTKELMMSEVERKINKSFKPA